MLADVIRNDDHKQLDKFLNQSISTPQLREIAYSCVVNSSYNCFRRILEHPQFGLYEPFDADGCYLPILHHAIRLGNLQVCKLLVEYRVNPLVCTGQCFQQNASDFTCEDAVRFAFRYVSSSNHRNTIALLLQTTLCTLVTNLVEACKRGDVELIESLLPSELRIHCAIKNFACRVFNLTNSSLNPAPSNTYSSSNSNTDNHKIIQQPLGTLLLKRLKSLGFSGLALTDSSSSREQQRQSESDFLLSGDILQSTTDAEPTFCHLLPLNDLLEWIRSQLKPLLLICVQNNSMQCLVKLLQIGFQVIPVTSSVSSTLCSSLSQSKTLELDGNQEGSSDYSSFDYSSSVGTLKVLVEESSSIRKQKLWIESVCSNEESAIHAAIRLGRKEAIELIIQWDPGSLSVVLPGTGMGTLPIHIASAFDRVECLKPLLISMDKRVLDIESHHNGNSHFLVGENCCALFSCRIHGSPALYKYYYCIDQFDCNNMTAFLLAIIHGHVRIVRELLTFTVKAMKITVCLRSNRVSTDHENIDENANLVIKKPTSFDDQHSLPDSCTNTIYSDVCPIDIYRKISGCWYFGTSVDGDNDDNNGNHSASVIYSRPMIIINPRCHQSLEGYAICGYFNALQLSVMTGNCKLVSVVVDYLRQEVNTYCTSCIHGYCYIQEDCSSSLPSSPALSASSFSAPHLTNWKTSVQSIITSPLGLACCLAEADEVKAVEIASILLKAGAVDVNNQLFVYTVKKSHHRLAGLLLSFQTLKFHQLKENTETAVSKVQDEEEEGKEKREVIGHLNLSDKPLQPSVIPNSFWYFSSIIPLWIKIIEEVFGLWTTESLTSSPASSLLKLQSLVMKENNTDIYTSINNLFTSLPSPSFKINYVNYVSSQTITRITLSNCGLQTLPWCLFSCVKNLKELDLSKNSIQKLPKQLPSVPLSYRRSQLTGCCWTDSLTYLDLSENHIEYLPSWLFVNKTHPFTSSNEAKLSNEEEKSSNDNNAASGCGNEWSYKNSAKSTHFYISRRRHYSESENDTNSFSIYHKIMGKDSFAPNLLYLLLSKNKLRTLPSEVWNGSVLCKLQFLDLSWNKISYLPLPHLLKTQFERSKQLYKQLSNMKIHHFNQNENRYSTQLTSNTDWSLVMNSQRVYSLPTDQILTPVAILPRSIQSDHMDGKSDRKMNNSTFECVGQQTSHLTHLWLHHNCLKSLHLTSSNPSSRVSVKRYPTSTHSFKQQVLSLGQICPNLVYLDASYNYIEHFYDLFLCPKNIIHIDLSYNRMRTEDRLMKMNANNNDNDNNRHNCYRLNDSVSSLSCRSVTRISLSANKLFCDNNIHNFVSYLVHDWNSDKTIFHQFLKLKHLNLRGNRFHVFPCDNLSHVGSEIKVYNVSKSSSTSSSPTLSSQSIDTSHLLLTQRKRLLFPNLKSLDLGENPNLQRICPGLVYSTNLRYLSLDKCISLIELPGDLFRLSNLDTLLLSETPFNEYLLPILHPTLKSFNQNTDEFSGFHKNAYTKRVVSHFKVVTDQACPFTRFRLMVVGPTGVGKTTLIRLLKASETFASFQNNSKEHSFKADHINQATPSSVTTGNLSDHASSLVQVTNLVLSRTGKPPEPVRSNKTNECFQAMSRHNSFCETLAFDIWDVVANQKVTNRVFNISASGTDPFHTSSRLPPSASSNLVGEKQHNHNISSNDKTRPYPNINTISADLDYPSEVLVNTQLGLHCEFTVYLVLWCVSDGLLGLNKITPWLMKIQSISPNSPIILIGTHSGLDSYCTKNLGDNSRIPFSHSNITRSDGSNNKTNNKAAIINNHKLHLTLMDWLVRSRFFTNPDLNAYGLPHLYGHIFLDLMDDVKRNKSSGKDYEALMNKIYDLGTLIHRAAHSQSVSNRTVNSLLPGVSVNASSHLSLLQLPIPRLYHCAERITQQLATEMHYAKIPPIMKVNKFLLELNRRLCDLLSNSTRIHLSSIYDNSSHRNEVPYVVQDSVNNLSPPPPSSTTVASSSLYLTCNTNGFYTYAEVKGILLFLSQIGTIVHFKHHKVLKNIVFLSPVWLLDILLKLITIVHNERLFGSSNRHLINALYECKFANSSSNITDVQYNQLTASQDNYGTNVYDDVVDPSCLKRNSAVINSSCLKELINSLMNSDIFLAYSNRNWDAVEGDVSFKSICIPLLKHLDLIISIRDDSYDDNHFNYGQFLIPSLLAARCFQPNLLHSYLQPAVIRYQNDFLSTVQKPHFRSQSVDVSTHRSSNVYNRQKLNQRISINTNNYNSMDNTDNCVDNCSDSNDISKSNNNVSSKVKEYSTTSSHQLVWHVQTSASKEMVRIYALTYIPPGFWVQLNTRLLNDSSLQGICGRIYSLSKLPPQLFEQLNGKKPEHCNSSTRISFNGDSCGSDVDDVSHKTGNLPPSQFSLKPEWTVWRRGMRLSLCHGQIGLARLQQLTRANCALLRNHCLNRSISKPNNQVSNNLPPSIPSSSLCKNAALLTLFHQNLEEWDEPCATEGEEVLTRNKRVIAVNNHTNCYSKVSSITSNTNYGVYRSGVVEAIKHSYEGRHLRLMNWVKQPPTTTTAMISTSLSPSSSTTFIKTRFTSDRSNQDCSLSSVKTAFDFALQSNGYYIDQEHDALQNSCLLEIYLPNLSIYWKYKSADNSSTFDSEQSEPLINDNNHSRIVEHCLNPDYRAIAELLTKLVNHVDTLLEDWYPDLGAKLNQSNEGVYLVERIIPCCACLAASNHRVNVTGSANQNTECELNGIGNNHTEDKHRSNPHQLSVGKQLSTSLQCINHENGLQHSVDYSLKPSVSSVPSCILTNEDSLTYYAVKTYNSNMTNPMSNDNTIKEKHSTNRYIPSAKWPWPFKRYQHKRAHSADPLHNKEYSNNNAFSLSTACNYVYGITVSEYIHWYMIQSSMKRGLKLKELYCPMHSSIPLWAPDLRFEDVTSDLLISADLVHLFKFLGRGAFGSVFTGSAGNIDHHIRQRNLYSITRKQKPRILDDDHSMKVDEINNEDGNYQTHKIAVKICSPVHPNLDNSSVNNSSSFAVPNDITKLSEGSTSSNLRDAFALYRQDQRRWLQHPVETCLIAYQEIRAELNILLPITMNCMKVYQMKFSKHHPPFHIHSYQKHSTPTASNRSYKNMSKLYNGIQERRLTYGCFSKCLQKKTDNNSDNNKLISNMHLSQQKNNLLVCCGIIYPNPIGFLMPLAPLGNLSDYFTSLLSSYQDLLKSSVSSSSMMTMPTTTSLEHNELFLDHPLHPLTMMCVTNQLAKALAYLHHLSIIHRDVKSENVLIWSMPPSMMLMSLSTLPNNYNPSQVHIVLTDYGASRFMSSPDDGCRGYVGTTGYMAPEILEYLGEQTYNTKVDIYAMGILICEMIQLEQPYKKSSSILFRLAQEVISGVRPEIPSHFLKRCPRTLINLMTYCWESDSNKRPTAQQIVQLTNPWWPSSNEVVNTSNSNNNDINSLKIDHISFLSSKRNDRIHLSSNIKRSMNVFSNSTRQKSSFNTLSNIVLNGFSHIQLVYCIDALKIVTCALVDDCYNLWLGGYNYYAESSLDDEQYIRIGLLFLIPLTTDISSESSIVLASWPRLYVLKQYSQGIVGHDTCRKLSDWPIRLCWLSDGDSKLKYVRKDSANNKTPRTMVTCLTILGELRVYGFNYKTMEYICLLKIQLSQYSKLSTHSIDNEECENLFHGVKCMLAYMKYNYHQNQFHSQHHRRPSSPSTGCIHYILCLASPQICIVTVHILSSLMVKFEKTTFVNLDQPIHSGVILPEICDSDVWFSQNGGKLLCYTWNNALHEICSSSLSNCFKLRLSWFVPLSSSSSSSSESKSSSSSLVTHFLLDTSMSANQDDLSEDNVHIYVWTYLKPHGKLDCWSAVSQNLLQSISLTCHLDKPFSQNFSTSEMFGSIRAMEWLTLSSDILLITTHGYLIHINVTHINTDNKSSSMKATETMLTATSENSSNHSFHSSASSSLPSVLFNIHVFHYHGVMSDEDFVLIAPLIPTTSSTSYSLSRILTIGKGYLDPLACINPSSSSALYTNTVQMCYDGNSNNKALSNQMNTAKCFSQENYYLVKLFCDKFLFP